MSGKITLTRERLREIYRSAERRRHEAALKADACAHSGSRAAQRAHMIEAHLLLALLEERMGVATERRRYFVDIKKEAT